MIVFDLECSRGHEFEGWFDSLDSFKAQNDKKLVSCPYCNDSKIKKVISPVAVKKSIHQTQKISETIDYKRLAKEVVDYVRNNFEDVGIRFASEALKIHYGVAERRNIRGSATSEEEQTLKQEGIDFLKIPFPKIDDDMKN